MTPSSVPTDTVSTGQAATMLGVDVVTVRKLLRDGRLGYTYRGTYKRIYLADLEKYVASQGRSETGSKGIARP
jgi:excisionase family DNA binding protein